MKTKNLFIAGVLAIAGTAFGQVETTTTTGLGLLNGGIGATPGNGSVFVGYQAGTISTGQTGEGQNTFVGHQSGLSNQKGSRNSFLGFNSGFNNNAANDNTFIGHRAGFSNIAGLNNTFIGSGSGFSNQANNNTFVGSNTGNANSIGVENTFVGTFAGHINTTGSNNIFMGVNAGASHDSGSQNIFIGNNSGFDCVNSGNNVAIGTNAGAHIIGWGNVYLGNMAGFNTLGDGNVFIGQEAGRNEAGSNKLYISNSADDTPLIHGDFNQNRLVFNGKVGITNETLANQANLFPTTAGSVNVSAYQLFVKGGILTEEVRVHLKNGTTPWADYVFADDYKLASLPEVEKYIAANGHLPNVPSAKQVKQEGIELGDMARIQQEKIEELTLYAIAQDKQLTEQTKKLEQQQKEIDELKAAVKALMAKQ